MIRVWSVIRAFYYRLLGKKVRYVYVPNKNAYAHANLLNNLSLGRKTQDDFKHTLWSTKSIGPLGYWIVDKKGFVVSELAVKKMEIDRHLQNYDNIYPFKPNNKVYPSVRDTIKASFEEIKKGTENG